MTIDYSSGETRNDLNNPPAHIAESAGRAVQRARAATKKRQQELAANDNTRLDRRLEMAKNEKCDRLSRL